MADNCSTPKPFLDRAVAQTPDPDAIRMLGEVNMKLLASPLMMPGKEYYTIQGGDYLQKIAKKYKNHRGTHQKDE